MMLVKKHASPRVAFQTPGVCLSLCSAVLKFLPRPPGTQKGDHISKKQRRNIGWNNANPCCNSLQIYAKDMWLLFLIEELIAYGISPNFCKFWETSYLRPMPSAFFPWISWDGETVLSFCLWRSFFTRKAPSCVKWKVEASCNHLWNLNLNNFTTFTDDIRWLYFKHWSFLKSWTLIIQLGLLLWPKVL